MLLTACLQASKPQSEMGAAMQAVYGKDAALPLRHTVDVAESKSDMPHLSFPAKLDEELPCHSSQAGLGGLQHTHSHQEGS